MEICKLKQQIRDLKRTKDDTILNDEESSAVDPFETSEAQSKPIYVSNLPTEFIEVPSYVTVNNELDKFHSGYCKANEQIKIKEEKTEDTSSSSHHQLIISNASSISDIRNYKNLI